MRKLMIIVIFILHIAFPSTVSANPPRFSDVQLQPLHETVQHIFESGKECEFYDSDNPKYIVVVDSQDHLLYVVMVEEKRIVLSYEKDVLGLANDALPKEILRFLKVYEESRCGERENDVSV